MLVLTRFVGERIILDYPGGQIVLTTCEIRSRGQRVRLGLDAPQEVKINREEVYEGEIHVDSNKNKAAGAPGT